MCYDYIGDNMKYVVKTLKTILITIWAVVAVFTTICLLSYNEYNVTEFGNYSMIIIDSDELEPKYYENDLVILKKQGQNKYAVGDEIFFYSGNKLTTNFVNIGEITNVTHYNDAESLYSINDKKVTYSNVIGNSKTAKVYKGYGLPLSILESKWGFMLFIILPTLFALVYEIYAFASEVRKELKG